MHSNPLSLWSGDPSRADQVTMALYQRVFGRKMVNDMLPPVTNGQLAPMPAHTLKANITGSTANAVDSSLSAIFDAELGNTNGFVATRVAGVWTAAAASGGSTPTGTGFVSVTAGVQDSAADSNSYYGVFALLHSELGGL